MKFRLTYEGPLRPTQRDALDHERDPLAPHKQAIRRNFHHQLKELWGTNKFLRECKMDPRHFVGLRPDAAVGTWATNESGQVPLVQVVADLHTMFGYRFVPLVMERWALLCSLDILFLRRDIPGSAVHAGDIDNRIKTLIDALRPPRSPNELVGEDATPRSDENPFFCLLEDDKQVSRLSVETDTLLDQSTTDNADQRKARLVITVEDRVGEMRLV